MVGDDDLMERYLEGDVPSTAELEGTLASGVAQASVLPVVCGSAMTGVGVDRLATLLAEIAPSPQSRPPVLARPRATGDRGGLRSGGRAPRPRVQDDL